MVFGGKVLKLKGLAAGILCEEEWQLLGGDMDRVKWSECKDTVEVEGVYTWNCMGLNWGGTEVDSPLHPEMKYDFHFVHLNMIGVLDLKLLFLDCMLVVDILYVVIRIHCLVS